MEKQKKQQSQQEASQQASQQPPGSESAGSPSKEPGEVSNQEVVSGSLNKSQRPSIAALTQGSQVSKTRQTASKQASYMGSVKPIASSVKASASGSKVVGSSQVVSGSKMSTSGSSKATSSTPKASSTAVSESGSPVTSSTKSSKSSKQSGSSGSLKSSKSKAGSSSQMTSSSKGSKMGTMSVKSSKSSVNKSSALGSKAGSKSVTSKVSASSAVATGSTSKGSSNSSGSKTPSSSGSATSSSKGSTYGAASSTAKSSSKKTSSSGSIKSSKASGTSNTSSTSSSKGSSKGSKKSSALSSVKSSKRKHKKGKKSSIHKVQNTEEFDKNEPPIEAMGLAQAEGQPSQEFDEREMNFSMKLIKSNLVRLAEIQPTVDTSESEYKKYSVEKNKPIMVGSKPVKCRSCMAIFTAHHAEYKSTGLVAKFYDPKKYDPKKNEYLRILRHISKKHPSIIGTWEVYYDGHDVIVFQEFAGYGALAQYVEHFGALPENKAQESAQQTLRAMDYMGDFGLTHRCLCPRHLMVCRVKSDWTVKLSGFQSTIVYWNYENEDIIYQPCRPMKDADGWHAPEVFSDNSKEVYDPIQADIFSFGLVIYYMFTKSSPMNPKKPQEVQENVKKGKYSALCRDILSRMLNLDSKSRLTFEAMSRDDWLKEA